MKANGNKSSLNLFVTGLLVSYFNYCVVWYATMKLPINLFVPFFVCVSLTGMAMGAFWSKKIDSRKAIIFNGVCSAGMLAFLGAAFFNMKVPTQYMLFMADFPVEKIHHMGWHIATEILSIPASVAVYCLLGYQFSRAFEKAENAPVGYAIHLCGFILGGLGAYLLVPAVGVYYPLMAGTLIVIFYFTGLRAAKVAAVVVSVALICFMKFVPFTYFLFSLDDYKHIKTHWSDYTKVDLVSFFDDKCASILYNNFMMSYVCPDAADDQFQRRKTFQKLAPGRDKVLVIGAAGGMSMISLLEGNPNIKKGIGVEINPVVVEETTTTLAKYGGDVYNRPGFKLIASDGRRFMDTDTEKYDLIFIDGIDNLQNFFLSSIVAVENYTFTEEGYDRIFNDRLEDDGIFILNWGGTVIDEIYPFLMSLPENVHYKLYWYVISEAQFAGVPLFLLVGAKDQAILDKYDPQLLSDTGMKHIDSPEDYNRDVRLTDNHPTLYIMQIYLMMFLTAAAFGAYILFLGKRFREALAVTGRGGAARLVYFVMVGTAYALLESYIIVKSGRFFSSPPVGVMVLTTLFLAGNTAANIVWALIEKRGGARPDGFVSVVFSAGLFAVCMAPVYAGTMVSIVAASTAAGFLMGWFWPAGISLIDSSERPMAYAMDGFGAALGTLIFQYVFLIYGLWQSAASAAAAAMLAALLFMFFAKRNKSVQT